MFAVTGDEHDIVVPVCQTFQEHVDLVMGQVVQLDPTGTSLNRFIIPTKYTRVCCAQGMSLITINQNPINGP